MIRKDWLIEQINNAEKRMNEAKVDFDINYWHGVKHGLTMAYKELTKPPETKQKQEKKIDHNKAYQEIVRYYVDKKGKTIEEANEIAKKAVENQQQRVLENS